MSLYYAVVIDGQKSSESPYGQKGAYPIAHADLAYGRNVSSGAGDLHGGVEIDHSYITLFTSKDSHATHHELVANLQAIVYKETTNKTKRDKITILEIAATDDAQNYKVMRSAEHPAAWFRYDRHSNLVVDSDKATIATIPLKGESATEKTELDFKNRRVNGK
jgi:hypothetical protein